MIPEIPSYLEKVFIIDDNLALLRRPNNIHSFAKYKQGDNIPPNFEVGMNKQIPLNTEVKVIGVKMDNFRNVYINVVPTEDADFIPSGWTRATNLQGSFMNELICFIPREWDLQPNGDNYTVIDGKSWIRSGKPSYKNIKENGVKQAIPVGTYVEVTARSNDTEPIGKHVRVRHMTIEGGEMVGGEPIGWTLATNLVEGNSKAFQEEAWLAKEGDNAAWKRGRYIGAKVLVGVVGTGGQLQHIAIETLQPYLNLMEAAKEENIGLSITSGFRTFGKQAALFNGWKAGEKGFNRAAPAGRSNHQNGIAFDLNTGGYDGAPVYDWMKKNATTYGFIRTVNKEHWHWEYQPELAAKFKKVGRFKLKRVHK